MAEKKTTESKVFDMDLLRKKDRLTYEEAAFYCNRSRRTMQRWANNGILKPARVTTCTVYLFRIEIDNLMETLREAESERSAEEAPRTARLTNFP